MHRYARGEFLTDHVYGVGTQSSVVPAAANQFYGVEIRYDQNYVMEVLPDIPLIVCYLICIIVCRKHMIILKQHKYT